MSVLSSCCANQSVWTAIVPAAMMHEQPFSFTARLPGPVSQIAVRGSLRAALDAKYPARSKSGTSVLMPAVAGSHSVRLIRHFREETVAMTARIAIVAALAQTTSSPRRRATAEIKSSNRRFRRRRSETQQ